VLCAEMLVEHLDVEVGRGLRPIGRFEGNVLIVVENRAAVARHCGHPCLAKGGGGKEDPYSTAGSAMADCRASGRRGGLLPAPAPEAGANGSSPAFPKFKSYTSSFRGETIRPRARIPGSPLRGAPQ